MLLIIGAIAVIIRSSQLPRNEAVRFINIYPIHAGRLTDAVKENILAENKVVK